MQAGDYVRVKTRGKEAEGLYMPNSDEKTVFLKLDSGYNLGIHRKNIKNIRLIKKFKEKNKKIEKAPFDRKLPTISILHTGGTIASKVDYRTGGVVSRFEPRELLAMFPELGKICNIKSRLVAQMFSEDMRFKHYELMAKAIEKEIKEGVDGIILTHGTDTMGYSSAALAFMLGDLPIPVILVGAQRSSDRGSSDAGVNLICAASFIAKTDFSGVAICMHENMEDKNCVILPALKTRKLHTSRRDAFKPVNDTIIAKIDYKSKKIDFIKKNYVKKDKKRRLKTQAKMEERVAILRVHPNLFPEQIENYKNYKGLVIEGTGLGHAPVGVPNEYCKINEKNLNAFRNLIKKGVIMVMTSQTIFGRVNMNVYSTGRDLQDIGMIPGEDLLTETAFIKLAWLLGNYKKDQVRELINKNLRGEIAERALVKEDFLE